MELHSYNEIALQEKHLLDNPASLKRKTSKEKKWLFLCFGGAPLSRVFIGIHFPLTRYS